MGWAHRHFCRPIQDITDVSQLRNHAQKDVRRTVALLRVWVRTGSGYGISEGYSGPGTQATFGRDAANVGNGVEASGQRPEVRSLSSCS